MTATLPQRNVPLHSPASDPGLDATVVATPEVSLITVSVVLLRHRWLIACLGLLFFTVFAFNSYSPDPVYTSTATFTPRQRSQLSASSQILQQLGIGGSGGSSGAYYIELIKSRQILGPVAESTYSFQSDTGRVKGRLIDIYGIRNPNRQAARSAAIGVLKSQILTTSGTTGMMTISVSSRYAPLSAMLVQRVLDELNRFNLQNRQQEAGGERRFIETQVEEAGMRLRQAEDELQVWTSANQNYTAVSPRMLEWDRLSRNVAMRQELYTALAKQLDQARIEEVRDSPVLTVLEPPEVPLGPDAPKWPTKAILGGLVGILFGIVLAFVHAYFVRRKEEETNEYEELESLKRQTADDLRHFWRPIGRILSTGRA